MKMFLVTALVLLCGASCTPTEINDRKTDSAPIQPKRVPKWICDKSTVIREGQPLTRCRIANGQKPNANQIIIWGYEKNTYQIPEHELMYIQVDDSWYRRLNHTLSAPSRLF